MTWVVNNLIKQLILHIPVLQSSTIVRYQRNAQLSDVCVQAAESSDWFNFNLAS